MTRNTILTLNFHYQETSVERLSDTDLYNHLRRTTDALGIPSPARCHVKRIGGGTVFIERMSCAPSGVANVQKSIAMTLDKSETMEKFGLQRIEQLDDASPAILQKPPSPLPVPRGANSASGSVSHLDGVQRHSQFPPQDTKHGSFSYPHASNPLPSSSAPPKLSEAWAPIYPARPQISFSDSNVAGALFARSQVPPAGLPQRPQLSQRPLSMAEPELPSRPRPLTESLLSPKPPESQCFGSRPLPVNSPPSDTVKRSLRPENSSMGEHRVSRTEKFPSVSKVLPPKSFRVRINDDDPQGSRMYVRKWTDDLERVPTRSGTGDQEEPAWKRRKCSDKPVDTLGADLASGPGSKSEGVGSELQAVEANLKLQQQIRELERKVRSQQKESFELSQQLAGERKLRVQSEGEVENLRQRLAEERQKRIHAELIGEDIRREMKEPFIVPRLLDIFIAMSKISDISDSANS